MKNIFSVGLLLTVFITGSLIFVTQVDAAANPVGTNVLIDGSVYFLANDGTRRPYLSREVMLSYAYNSIDKVQLGSEEDKALPLGAPMVPRDGTVVCSNSSYDWGTCYLITDYKKAAFANTEVLTQQGFDLAEAIYADLSLMLSDAPIIDGDTAHRYGTLVNHNGTVYFVGKNGLVGVPSLDILTSWGYTLNDVVPANEADKNLSVRLDLESRFGNEPRPFEPIITEPLQLANEDKFIVPFAGRTLEITEGWLYSPEERSIHGYTQHGGIDFAYLRGTPIYAAADGYAVASTHLAPLTRKYEEKNIGFGLGEFVQIWHPKQGVYTSYSHLQRVNEGIPYFSATCKNGACDPDVVYNSTEKIIKQGKLVKQGELIGWMGDSGLSWGYSEAPQVERDHKQDLSWDEVHLHFEMYTRDPVNFYKAKRYDPFGIYGRLNQYQDQSYWSPQSLWKLDSNNQPVLAK